MSHIVISGPLKFENIYLEFEKVIHKIDNKTIIKYTDCFLNKDKNIILMSTVVIENQRPISFYITIISKENQITIRLEPITDPEKTFGVKKSLALIAMKILEKENNLKITKTNLQDFITQ
ncbi:hypothetical protein [Candidatus Nitrosocosmicus sp. T]